MSDREQPEVVDNPERGRFELVESPDRAHLAYERDGNRLTLVHTEVGDELEGRGVGSALVRGALEIAEEQGLTVVPECRFVAGWLERHPERAAELDVAQP